MDGTQGEGLRESSRISTTRSWLGEGRREEAGRRGDGFVSREAAPDAVRARERQATGDRVTDGDRRSLQAHAPFPPHAFPSSHIPVIIRCASWLSPAAWRWPCVPRPAMRCQ